MWTTCQNGLGTARLASLPKIARTRARRAAVAFLEQQTPSAQPSVAAGAAVPVRFKIAKRTEFGEHLKVVGSEEVLGGWEVDRGLTLEWAEGHIWSATVDIPVGSTAEYKLVHCVPGAAPIWEFCPNRVLAVGAPAAELAVALGWNDPEASAVTIPAIDTPLEEAELEKEQPQPALQAAAAAVDAFAEQMRSAMGGAAEAAAPEATEVLLVEEPEVLLKAEVEAEEKEAAVAEEKAAEASAATSDFLKTAAKTAGAVALGVAGAAALSVLAVDIADTAMLGAMAAVAGGAVLSGSGARRGTAGKASAADGEAAGEEVEDGASEQRISGAGEPGLYMAVGLLSALDAGKAYINQISAGVAQDEPLDAGKAMARSLEGKPAEAEAEAGPEEEA